MSPRLKSSLILALVFLLGALTGGGLATARTARRLHRASEPPPIGQGTQSLMRVLDREVALDEEQQRRVTLILDGFEADRDAMRRELNPRLARLRNRLFEQLRAEMRPEQLAGFQRFVRRAQTRDR